jgi:hypothetical protein
MGSTQSREYNETQIHYTEYRVYVLAFKLLIYSSLTACCRSSRDGRYSFRQCLPMREILLAVSRKRSSVEDQQQDTTVG